MRILICAVEAPLPPTNGFRLLLRALVDELRLHHDVRIVAFRASDQVPPDDPDPDLRLVERPNGSLAAAGTAVVRAAIRRRPRTADPLADAMSPVLAEELAEFRPDVVHVTSGRLGALGRRLDGTPSVLAALDAGHLNVEARARAARGVRRRLLQVEAGFARRFERDDYPRFDRVVVVSDEDARELEATCPGLSAAVIPNGVDASFYSPDPTVVRHGRRAIFTGVMSYAPNVVAAEFLARRVFPRVQRRRPDARLALVGRKPAPRVQALAALDGVDVTGEVADVRPWLVGSAVFVCPMLTGTGIKNKLLEAMATGLPCVATPLALQGLAAVPGRDLLVGESEDELADHMAHLLRDEEEAQRIGRAAREYVLEHHDWSAVARAYEDVYEQVARPALAVLTT